MSYSYKMAAEADHYVILGLPSGEEGSKLTEKDITRAYKAKALKLHPDKRPGDPLAHAAFLKLQNSYKALQDEKSRVSFDHKLRVERDLELQKKKKQAELAEKERLAREKRARIARLDNLDRMDRDRRARLARAEEERIARLARAEEERIARLAREKEDKIARRPKDEITRVRNMYGMLRGLHLQDDFSPGSNFSKRRTSLFDEQDLFSSDHKQKTGFFGGEDLFPSDSFLNTQRRGLSEEDFMEER